MLSFRDLLLATVEFMFRRQQGTLHAMEKSPRPENLIMDCWLDKLRNKYSERYLKLLVVEYTFMHTKKSVTKTFNIK